MLRYWRGSVWNKVQMIAYGPVDATTSSLAYLISRMVFLSDALENKKA